MMHPEGLRDLLDRYGELKLAILGDVCLDRYFEIDPSREEISIETGLKVYNVENVRCQPGAAGTILNNLVALGIPEIHLIGFCGHDAEGWQLRKALDQLKGVQTHHFLTTDLRKTFTYTKPLLCHQAKPPQELNRIDQKNWTPTPPEVSEHLIKALRATVTQVDALIVMDQVDIENTGVITKAVLSELDKIQQERPEMLIMSDSRRSLKSYPPLTFKMNASELGNWVGADRALTPETVAKHAVNIAKSLRHQVFVSMAEDGIVSAHPNGRTAHCQALPVRGPIDVVGAGDAVTANLVAAMAAGAKASEALHLAMMAASCVIHQLGTTGVATRDDLLKDLTR